jgi:hypothetical protein
MDESDYSGSTSASSLQMGTPARIIRRPSLASEIADPRALDGEGSRSTSPLVSKLLMTFASAFA